MMNFSCTKYSFSSSPFQYRNSISSPTTPSHPSAYPLLVREDTPRISSVLVVLLTPIAASWSQEVDLLTAGSTRKPIVAFSNLTWMGAQAAFSYSPEGIDSSVT